MKEKDYGKICKNIDYQIEKEIINNCDADDDKEAHYISLLGCLTCLYVAKKMPNPLEFLKGYGDKLHECMLEIQEKRDKN